MKNSDVISRIQSRFEEIGNPAEIPLLVGRTFEAQLVADGITVSNLHNQPRLPWKVFTETVALLEANGGRAARGNAMNGRLGDPLLPLNSVEGHIAHIIYNKQIGQAVFRRITPIACILIWAGICRPEPGELLLDEKKPAKWSHGSG